MTLGITTLYHYAESPILFAVMLSGIMLNVIMLSVIMMSVIMWSVIMLSVLCWVSWHPTPQKCPLLAGSSLTPQMSD